MMQNESKIKVDLVEQDENDYLIFNFDRPIKLNINTCTNDDLKLIFCEVLKMIVSNKKKEFYLEIVPDYKKGLFIDVFTEYISVIN